MVTPQGAQAWDSHLIRQEGLVKAAISSSLFEIEPWYSFSQCGYLLSPRVVFLNAIWSDSPAVRSPGLGVRLRVGLWVFTNWCSAFHHSARPRSYVIQIFLERQHTVVAGPLFRKVTFTFSYLAHNPTGPHWLLLDCPAPVLGSNEAQWVHIRSFFVVYSRCSIHWNSSDKPRKQTTLESGQLCSSPTLCSNL